MMGTHIHMKTAIYHAFHLSSTFKLIGASLRRSTSNACKSISLLTLVAWPPVVSLNALVSQANGSFSLATKLSLSFVWTCVTFSLAEWVLVIFPIPYDGDSPGEADSLFFTVEAETPGLKEGFGPPIGTVTINHVKNLELKYSSSQESLKL